MEVEKLVICISMLMRFEKYNLSGINKVTYSDMHNELIFMNT